MSTSRTRVAITGMGIRTPAGNDPDTLLATMVAGRGMARTIESLVESSAPVTFGCLVPPFDVAAVLPVRDQQKLERVGHLAVAAAMDAMADCGLTVCSAESPDGMDGERFGVAVGTSAAGAATSVETTAAYVRDGVPYPAFTVPKVMPNSTAARIAISARARGSCLTYSTACASGSTAIGEAANQIRAGRLDAVLAGGADAPVTFAFVASFHQLGALSRRHDDPAAASRPFDAERDGFVIGEGAAFVVLERWDHAVARGARIHGEVLGYASNCDAHNIVAPSPDGVTASRCITAALRDADLSADDIGHVNAHGTSTMLNDEAEARAIVASFHDHSPPITASKGVIGHSLGAAGAVEAVVSVLCAARGIVPPVANFSTDRAPGGIDIVAGTPRSIPVQPVLSNSFGFGGHNSCLVLAPRPAPAEPVEERP